MNTDNFKKLEAALQDAQTTLKTIREMPFDSKAFPSKAGTLGSQLYHVTLLSKLSLLDIMSVLKTRDILGVGK
jgi:hypothetical protein